MSKTILFYFSMLILTAAADESVLCTTSSCSDITCDDIPKACQVQNATANGVFLPSPNICNCCDYCIVNLAKGEACTVGDPSSLQHTTICGPGLTCIPQSADDTDGTCQPMSTACALEQQSYDSRRLNGTVGAMELRPECDDDGLYASYKCIPGQTCYCQSENGTRIFGEADFSSVTNYMPCECSRKYYQAIELIGRELHPDEHFRCKENGDYDNLQCIGEWCLCVDTSDGAPTYPTDLMVNMTMMTNETLKCYNNTEMGIFYKKCEKEYMEILTEVREYKKAGYDMVLLYEFPNCDIDGTYNAVQENTTHKYCVDKKGTILTAVSKTDQKELANNMNCKCIRALQVMSSSETPSCSANGNYEPIQCRRGMCRCVDENGNQICSGNVCKEVDEIDVDTLKCVDDS